MKSSEKKYKIGIALGGGGTRGFAHLGVIKALHEKGIYPDVISGASAGAIAGSLIASDIPADKALTILGSKGFFRYAKFRFPKKGLFTLDKLSKKLQNCYPVTEIQDLRIPLYVALTNFNTGKAEYHTSGPLAETVIASSSIPVLFRPIKLTGHYYIDGGISDNVPHKPLLDICEKVIAVNLIPVVETSKVKGMKHVIFRTLDLIVNVNIEKVKNECDVFIEPKKLIPHAYLNGRKAKEIFDIGYNYVKNIDLEL